MNLMPWLLIIPLAWALLSLLAPRWPVGLFAITGMLVQLVAASLLAHKVYFEGVLTISVGDWDTPLGISLVADGLSTLLVLMTALIGLFCALFALRYLPRYPREQQFFWPLFWFLMAALNGIWLAADLFNLYVGLELLTLAAVGLVALSANRHALGASLRYLYAGLLGSLAYLLGVALLYGAYGTLAMGQLNELMAPDLTTLVALALITLGLLIKSAIFPLHTWLPPAHGGALAPISALLSALVVKASFYTLARIWLQADAVLLSTIAAQFLGMLGAGAIFWGGWQAFRQTDIKMLVAYSTVSQLGYLMLVFPLVTGASAEAAQLAWQGSMLHVIAHGFAKAAMFLAAGTLVLALGAQRLQDFAGVSRTMPLSLFAFGLAGVSLMGLPPSGGFNAKWLLLQSAIHSAQWHWVVVIIAGGLVTAAYIFRVFRVSFDANAAPEIKPVPHTLVFSALVLALMAIALGFASGWPLAQMQFPGGAL